LGLIKARFKNLVLTGCRVFNTSLSVSHNVCVRAQDQDLGKHTKTRENGRKGLFWALFGTFGIFVKNSQKRVFLHVFSFSATENAS